MKLLEARLESSHNLFFAGDDHEGSKHSSQSAFLEFLGMVKAPYMGCANNYVVSTGDQLEAITIGDPRYAKDKLNDPLPLAQLKRAIAKRKEIANKHLVVLEGNHCAKLWHFGNLAEELANGLGCAFGTYTCKLSIKDKWGRLMYKVFATHGSGTIRSVADDPIRREANMRLSLKRKMMHKAGDCAVMVMGHSHRLMVTPPQHSLYLTDDGEKIRQHYTGYEQNAPYIHPDARWYGNSGSFCRLYVEGESGYAERAGYDPMELGFLILRVRDKKIVGLDPIYLGV